FVELSPLASPAGLAPAIAKLLDLPEEPSTPLMDVILAYLRTRKLLLLLDGCEHLRAECAQMVDKLLRATESLQILATSYDRLETESAELIYRIGPLAVPTFPLPLASLGAQ